MADSYDLIVIGAGMGGVDAVVRSKQEMAKVGRARAMGETKGFVKLVVEPRSPAFARSASESTPTVSPR